MRSVSSNNKTKNANDKHIYLNDSPVDGIIITFDIKYLLSLPDDIFQYHFLQYLSLKDFGRLDCAVFNRNHRNKYLEKIANSILRSWSMNVRTNCSKLKWLKSRKLYVMHISLTGIVLSASDIMDLGEVFRYCDDLHLIESYITLSLIVSQCEKLKRLTLKTTHGYYGCNRIVINEDFSKYFTSLQYLNLTGCKGKITDDAVITFSKNCTGLQSLNLSECKNITDKSIHSFSMRCTGLQLLNLGWCKKITDESVISISKNCRGLQSLDLTWCEKITDESVISISNNCIRLQTLNLTWCSNITDESVISISKNCKGLQSLNLTECAKITDGGVISISEYCTGLQSLNLGCCSNITDESVISISKNCTGLQALNLYGCSNITDESVI